MPSYVDEDVVVPPTAPSTLYYKRRTAPVKPLRTLNPTCPFNFLNWSNEILFEELRGDLVRSALASRRRRELAQLFRLSRTRCK